MSQADRPIDDPDDHSDKFTISPVGLVVTQCLLCDHMSRIGGLVCRAFPGRIPTEIVENRADHSEPFEGDDGIRFNPRPDAQPALLDALRAHFARR